MRRKMLIILWKDKRLQEEKEDLIPVERKNHFIILIARIYLGETKTCMQRKTERSFLSQTHGHNNIKYSCARVNRTRFFFIPFI